MDVPEIKYYLTVQLTLWPEDKSSEGVDKLKEMIESNGTSFPGDGLKIYHGDEPIAEIMKLRLSKWPKPCLCCEELSSETGTSRAVETTCGRGEVRSESGQENGDSGPESACGR